MRLLNQNVQWHLTEVCSNRCKHCYIGDSTNNKRRESQLDFNGLLRILNNIGEFEKKYDVSAGVYSLTGGDPFEHPDFERLMEELYLRKKVIKILGIPERITKETLELLDKFHVDTYQLSLDGMQDTHDTIRGNGSFDKTINAIEMLNQYSRIHPHIMYTLHEKNCEELFELIEYLDYLGLDVSFSFDFLVLQGQAKSNFNIMDKTMVDRILEKYRKKLLELKERGSKLVLREKVKLFETFNVKDANVKFKQYSYVSGCPCGIGSVSILPNGDLLPCRRLPITIGNLTQEKYSDLFLNNVMMRKLRRISSYKLCWDCDYAKVCRGCPALSYSTTGDAFGELIYCNRKKKVEPELNEPPLDCTEEEEFEYIMNNLSSAIQKEGIEDNMEAIKYDIFRRYLLG